MRTASRVLGIVGGCIALLIALFAIFGGVVFMAIIPNFENVFESEDFDFDNDFDDSIFNQDEMEQASRQGGMMFLAVGSVIFICGVLGIVGGILVKKHNILSGIFMLIGGVISFFTVWGIIVAILLILGGIFALINESKDSVPVAKAID